MANLIWKKVLLSGLILLPISFCSAKQTTGNDQRDYILFISSVNFQQKWTKNLYWHMYTHFKELDIPIQSETLSIPAMISKSEAESRTSEIPMRHKKTPKVVIFDGELAWMVCRSLFDTSWKEVPAIIGSSKEYVPASLEVLFSEKELTPENTISSEEWKKGYNVTTLKRPFFIKETIGLMQQILPEMNKVVLISDEVITSSLVRMQTEKTIKKHFPELELQHLVSISNEDMVDSLRKYDKHTGIIYHSWLEKQKENGQNQLVDHMRELVSTFTCNPIFLLVDHGMETNWFAGGHFIPIEAFGEKLIKTVHQILDGTPAREIPSSQGGVDSAFLSYTHLINNGIIPALHPRGEIKYFNAPLRFYEQYKLQILLAICIFCILFLIIVFYIYILKQDKKQQKHENQLLKQKEQLKEFYESVLDNLPVAVTIKKTKNDFKYVFWNKKAHELSGCQKMDRDELNNECFRNSAFGKRILKMDEEVISQKKLFSTILQFPHQKDTLFLQISKTVVPYSEIESRLVSIYVDISDIYKNKQRLETLNKKHELTLKTAQVTSWIYNIPKNYIEFSENEYYAVKEAEALIHPEDLPRLKENYKSIIEGKAKEIHTEYRTKKPGEYSQYRWMLTSSIVGKYNKAGKPEIILSASIDLHVQKLLELELRDMREKAEKANRLKSAFIATISREVRTPLNAISGFSELLVETEDRKEKESYLKIINSSNDLLLKLINDMLDLTLIEAGTLEFSFSTIDANELLDLATQPSVIEGIATEVSLTIEKPFSSYMLSTDKLRVSQVLTNFMTNAVKYTKKGEIRIGYCLQGSNTLYFYVKDTGCGMDLEKQKTIFDHSYLLDSIILGNGLGLTLCEMYIKGLGGSIGVKSEPGKGSEFWFTIPHLATPT